MNPPPCSETGTQTDTRGSCLQNNLSPATKSFSVQTDPVDLSKCTIDLSKCTISDSAFLSSKQEEIEDDNDSTFIFDQENELQRRLNPTTPEDFEKLQTELIQWRSREERKIAALTAKNPEKKQAMTRILLSKEACILRKIDTLKNAAIENLKVERIQSIMNKLAEPKRWEMESGSICSVGTPATVQAREMKEVYDGIRRNIDNVQARIDLLQRAKVLVETLENHSSLAKDVRALIDRELEMLSTTELGSEMLAGLRRRMLNSFAKLVTKESVEKAWPAPE